MRLIDADELKAKVEAMVEHKIRESDYDYGCNQTLDYVADILIEDAPTIDAEPVKHGRWIDRGTVCQRYECSVCGDQHDWLILPNNINFCPNCGAKMDKGGEREEE